jgi:glycine cleavage system H protein
MAIPAGFKFAKTDEWVKVDGNIATIGVSDYAQEQLSDVVFVEIAVSPGEEVKKGKPFATVESVKAASDVNAPVSGKVVEINEALADSPEQVNTEPYGSAWMIKVELANPADLDDLMDGSAYEAYCQTREH